MDVVLVYIDCKELEICVDLVSELRHQLYFVFNLVFDVWILLLRFIFGIEVYLNIEVRRSIYKYLLKVFTWLTFSSSQK